MNPLLASFFRSLFLCLAVLAVCPTPLAWAANETLISFGSNWNWRKGTNEASTPITSWRTNKVNDATWVPGTTPFSYGTNSTGRDDGVTSGTIVNGMINTYRCIFLRRTFVITNVTEIQSVNFTVYYDDGFVAWINGTNVLTQNMPTASPTISTFASNAHEADPAVNLPAQNSPQNYLVVGTNVISVQVLKKKISSPALGFKCSMKITKVKTLHGDDV